MENLPTYQNPVINYNDYNDEVYIVINLISHKYISIQKFTSIKRVLKILPNFSTGYCATFETLKGDNPNIRFACPIKTLDLYSKELNAYINQVTSEENLEWFLDNFNDFENLILTYLEE